MLRKIGWAQWALGAALLILGGCSTNGHLLDPYQSGVISPEKPDQECDECVDPGVGGMPCVFFRPWRSCHTKTGTPSSADPVRQ